MFLTPFYIAMTFIKTWRIRSFRARLLEFLSGNTSVAFCKVPENAAETPTLSSKLCTNPKNAHLCDLLDYTNATRVCSMKPNQSIELRDWVSCAGGLPLGSKDSSIGELDIDVLLECELEPVEQISDYNIVSLDTIGEPHAWKAGTHLAIILKTNMESLSVVGFNFVREEFIIDHKLPVVRIQTVQLNGEPNKAIDPSMRSLRSDVQHSLKKPLTQFQWTLHAALLRKLSKVVDIKTDRNITSEMNGNGSLVESNNPINLVKKNVSLTDVSVNTDESSSNLVFLENFHKTKSAVDTEGKLTNNKTDSDVQGTKTIVDEISKVKATAIDEVETKVVEVKSTHENASKAKTTANDLVDSKEKPVVEDQKDNISQNNENVTVEFQHKITPKKTNLKLDLKKGKEQLSSSLMNISSQIKSVTTHKRIVSSRKQPQEAIAVKSETKVAVEPKEKKSRKESRPLVNTKSPNVLIYADSVVNKDNLEASLRKVLDCERYTIYGVTKETLESGAWQGRAALVAVSGDVDRAAPLLLAYLLAGGRVLALCSDLLHTVLPYYKTAEVRENEVVQFSYDRWHSVRMKHHIFCYQASPAKKQFSTENDRQPSKYTGHPGHELGIQVLASEETWRTPSLVQATDNLTNGIAIFSQIHLETDPSDYLGEEGAHSNEARVQILHKILGDLLHLHVVEPQHTRDNLQFTKGFFLGNHVHKMALVDRLCAGASERLTRLGSLTVQWCDRDEIGSQPQEDLLPVCMHTCPDHFDTVEYFDNLTSTALGRLVVYTDIMSSTQELVTGGKLAHGLAVVARRQIRGRGRGNNTWLSAAGTACVSIQVWRKLSPTASLIQIAGALAAIKAIRSIPGYDQLDIRIKWPNDIYYGREVKIGGVITNADCQGDELIVNIGTGVNISNSAPTTCINDIITEYNTKKGTKLPPLSCERFIARYCSHMEKELDHLDEEKGAVALLEQCYKYWLHENETVKVLRDGEEHPIQGVVSGMDLAGFLRVRTAVGELTVQPDGNSFDMMTGLIAPKAF